MFTVRDLILILPRGVFEANFFVRDFIMGICLS